jgi:hypothetical protein
LSLCNSYCVPVLLYGTETFDLNKTEKSWLLHRLTDYFSSYFVRMILLSFAIANYLCPTYHLIILLILKNLNFLSNVLLCPIR